MSCKSARDHKLLQSFALNAQLRLQPSAVYLVSVSNKVRHQGHSYCWLSCLNLQYDRLVSDVHGYSMTISGLLVKTINEINLSSLQAVTQYMWSEWFSLCSIRIVFKVFVIKVLVILSNINPEVNSFSKTVWHSLTIGICLYYFMMLLTQEHNWYFSSLNLFSIINQWI